MTDEKYNEWLHDLKNLSGSDPVSAIAAEQSFKV